MPISYDPADVKIDPDEVSSACWWVEGRLLHVQEQRRIRVAVGLRLR